MRFLFNVLCPSFVFEVGGFDFFYLLYIYIAFFSATKHRISVSDDFLFVVINLACL